MKNLLLIISMSVVGWSACAQSSAVKKVYVFLQERMPGNIPVDDNGKPLKGVDTLHFIYMECSGKAKPVINEVWIGNKCFTADMEAADKLPGKLKSQKGNF